MYKMYQEVPFPPTQFNYFADTYENPMQNYYFPMNQQQTHAPQYILPYAGVDLRCLEWCKVIEILEKQAESFKLFQLNAAYGYDWANEQNSRLILEFNAQFRKEIELHTDEQSTEQLSVFKLPSLPTVEKEQLTKETATVQGSKKRKRTSNKKNLPKKSKKGMTETGQGLTVIDPQFFRYSPAVSPISPTIEGDSCEGNVFYDTMN